MYSRKKLTKADFQERYAVEPMYAMTEESCWTWIWPISQAGYGRFSEQFAHIMSYERKKGKVPEGLELDHLCRVRNCINPAHLEAVTHQENVRRGVRPPSFQLEKTHCPRGHEYNEENTYRYKTRRCCRTCNNIISLARYHARKG